MSNENPGAGRIAVGIKGFGTADETMLHDRASELAKMDGREHFNEKDLAQARAELQSGGQPPPPPEVAPEAEGVRTWYDTITDSGHRAPTQPLEDEANIGEQLVQEGIEEADHERRLSAEEGKEP